MQKILLRVLLCLGLSLAIDSASAEGWSLGGSVGPAVIGYSLANRFNVGFGLAAGLQVGYQRADGLTTRLAINLATPSFDIYQQLGNEYSESGLYLGAGVVYNPVTLFFSSSAPLLTPLGLKGIVGYEFKGQNQPWGIFVEYSPTVYLVCALDSICRDGPIGSISGFIGLTNVQIGVNYRF
jgi:hypothetical protein